LKPEFKPKLSTNVLDVSNFDKMFTADEAVHSVIPQMAAKKIAKAAHQFDKFDAS